LWFISHLIEKESSFPRRLKELYSHWYWRDDNGCGFIFFREKTMSCKREIAYISKLSGPTYRIPLHLREKHWLELIKEIESGSFSKLKVVSDWKLADTILGKIESPDGSIVYVLPRFGDLKFTRPSGEKEVMFTESHGMQWNLCLNQRFEDTLFRFDSYLCVESGDHMEVLIPDGHIDQSKNNVVIEPTNDPGDNLTMFWYTEHKRDGKALLALFTVTSEWRRYPNVVQRRHSWPAAIWLVRSLCHSAPLDTALNERLSVVEELAKHVSPALYIVCCYVRDSQQCLFESSSRLMNIDLRHLYWWIATCSANIAPRRGRVDLAECSQDWVWEHHQTLGKFCSSWASTY